MELTIQVYKSRMTATLRDLETLHASLDDAIRKVSTLENTLTYDLSLIKLGEANHLKGTPPE